MIVLGVVAAVTGVVVFHLALVMTLRANSGIRIPFFRNADVVPRGSVAMRAIGAALLVFGAVMLGVTAWYLPLLVVLAGLVAALAAIVVHNAAVPRRERV